MTTTDPQALRREADRLAEKAAEAERHAALQEERRRLMKPQWRVADLIHTYFGHHVGGGPMDAGDEWYYELPTGRNVEQRWIEEWISPGREHQHYLKAAEAYTRKLYGGKIILKDDHYETAECGLQVLAEAIGTHRTMVGVRVKRERYDQSSLDIARKEAVASIDKLHELASARPAP